MKFFTRRRTKSPDIMLQNLEDGARVSHRQPPRQSRIVSCFESLLPRLQLPAAVLIGASITALTTFALVRHVQHEIANGKVSSDPDKWMQKARTAAYDPCYNGCDDCDDTSWAYDACNITARANVTGVICDGNLMWNWAERYPIECLRAVGEFYKVEALRNLKRTYRNQLAVVIFTVLAGIIGAAVTYEIWGYIVARSQARAHSGPPVDPPEYEELHGGSSPPPYFPSGMRGGGRGAGRIALIITAFASILSRSHAYPCTGHDPIANQYFTNANKTLYGVVHGWFSNCYDYSCGCSDGCSNLRNGINGGTPTSCPITCSTCTTSDTAPITYVNKTMGHVQACGFELVDTVGGDVNVRIANPLIEKNWWVKISVNMFNLTDVTDPSVICLHDFAN